MSNQRGAEVMWSTACAGGESPRLDLTQSYAWHQSCPGMVLVPGQREPEACSCPHHGMARGPARRRVSLRTKARLFLAVAVLLFAAWACLR